MNLESFELDQPLDLEPSQVKEALRCLLHTIIFNRALGLISPRDVECDAFDISYARVEDDRIESTLEKNIDKLHQTLGRTDAVKCSVSVSFQTKSSTKTWFSTKEEKLCWERWVIPITIARKPVKSQDWDRRHAARTQNIRNALGYVIRMVNDKKDHIPPFNINNKQNMGDVKSVEDSWGIGTLKKMLKTGLSDTK